MLISQCHFDRPPFELMGPLLGPLKQTAFMKPMGPLKSMGRGFIVPPAPPPPPPPPPPTLSGPVQNEYPKTEPTVLREFKIFEKNNFC